MKVATLGEGYIQHNKQCMVGMLRAAQVRMRMDEGTLGIELPAIQAKGRRSILVW